MTVVLTDIEGSTQLWESHPEDMETAVRGHNSLVTDLVERHGGRVLRYTGDGVLAVFDEAASAVVASVEVQQTFVNRSWGAIGHLRVRIGMNTGPCRIENDEIIGRLPNLAARLEQAAHGNQILMPSPTAQACAGLLAPDVQVIDLGTFTIRGFADPVDIFTVAAPMLPTAFPPLRVPLVDLDELPPDEGTLFGRSVEVADLSQAVTEHRLVTVWGPGGTGKTRVAIDVARGARSFANGSKLIDISSVRSDAEVIGHCVASVRAQPIGTERPDETLVRVLGGLHLMLILDGCEQWLEGTRQLVKLMLDNCPSIHLLVTTQECLRLPQEVSFELGPLEVPSESTVDHAVLARVDSVRLFVDRAQRVVPSFRVNVENARQIASICRALDGMPMALALAALRLDVETIEELADWLSAVGIEPSAQWVGQELLGWRLVHQEDTETDDRQLLIRLAAFVGPFPRSIAADIAMSVSSEAGLDRLIRRSIVVRHHSHRDRLYILGPTRASIQATLSAQERRLVRDAHADTMMMRAANCAERMLTHEEAAAVVDFRLDFADHRRAMAHLLEVGDDERAARLLREVFMFCLFQPRPEVFVWARTLSTRLLASSPSITDVLGAAAIGAWFSGDLEAATGLSHRALQLARGTTASTLWARTALVDALAFSGRLVELPVHFVGLVDELRDRSEPFWQVNGLGFEALGLATMGEIHAGRIQADRALALARRIDNPDCVGWALHALGRVMTRVDPGLAMAAFESAIEAFRSVGSRLNMAPAVAEWTRLKLETGERRDAARGVLELLDLLVVSGNRAHFSQALRLAAHLMAAGGQREIAALILLSRRELPEMPTNPIDGEVDDAMIDDLRREVGAAWPMLRVRALATAETELIALVLKAVAATAEDPFEHDSVVR